MPYTPAPGKRDVRVDRGAITSGRRGHSDGASASAFWLLIALALARLSALPWLIIQRPAPDDAKASQSQARAEHRTDMSNDFRLRQ